MLIVNSEVLKDKKTLLNLWKHECTRVIADRFTNKPDKDWFEKALTNVIEDDYGSEALSLVDSEPYFVDFLRDAPEPTGDVIKSICLFTNKMTS